eukprot:COSAG04_NODE_30802_length_260_cov_0.981366_1_plen_43_part_10
MGRELLWFSNPRATSHELRLLRRLAAIHRIGFIGTASHQCPST